MRTSILIACSALTAAATNSPPPVAVSVCTASVENVTAETNAPPPVVVAEPPIMPEEDIKTVKIAYPDVADADFHPSEWAAELAEKAEEGVHIRNGQVLVVARIPYNEDAAQMIMKTRAKFRALQILRKNYPDLPQTISTSCRVLFSGESEDEKWHVCVMAFDTQLK